MSIFEALWGGFSSFFSIWQVCILQISPFFLAFITGLYLRLQDRQSNPLDAAPNFQGWVIAPYIAFAIGFTLFYSLLIASGLGIGRTLTYNIGNLRLISGGIILCVSLYLIFADRIAFLRQANQTIILSVLSLLLGITFAIIYSPCITPTMSDIMGLATRPQTATEGFKLALFYGSGLSLALGVAVTILILLLKRTEAVKSNARISKDICGVILIIPAILNLTGLMVQYKAFFLGLLV